MNILFCGDNYIEDGIIITTSSLMRNVEEELHITVFTMDLVWNGKHFLPISSRTVDYLNDYVKQQNPASTVTVMDIGDLFKHEFPEANSTTRFTPYCMLRLYADQIEGMPDRILYLDGDIICRRDISDFYHQDIDGYEFAGVLDHYGKWFFHQNPFRMDYINSGVLLLNMERIRETHLFEKCRERCRSKKMFMPDQSSLNKLAERKKICNKRYNEQRKVRDNTVIQHFTTTFKYFPWLHTLTVKPWQIERVHRELKLHEYDDILDEYKSIKADLNG